jgi:hypothetical protein
MVGDQEQHEIAGRMMSEYVATKRTLAALNSKAAGYASILRRVSANLAPDSENPHQHSRSLSGPSWIEVFEKYPTREEIAATASEIETTTKRKRELLASLKEIGFEPRD